MKKFYLWPQPKNSRGSTLIELLVVISILILIISIAIPGLSFLKQQNLSHQLDKLQIICQFLQKKALSDARKQYLIFNPTEQSFFYSAHKEILPNGLYFGVLPNIYGPPAHPKEPIKQSITFPDNRITFYPNGTISAGTVYLMNQNKQLYALTIPVSQVSFIRKYKFQANQWLYLK